MKTKTKDLNYWKNNCEEDYLHTPISVLRYISELEKQCDMRIVGVTLPTDSEIVLEANTRYIGETEEMTTLINKQQLAWNQGAFWMRCKAENLR